MSVKAAKMALGTGLVVTGTAVLVPTIIVGAVNAVGFTASGVSIGEPKHLEETT